MDDNGASDTVDGDAEAVQVDIVSDVMCPWCYVGKRRFERALPLLDDIPLDIRWRPYQLDPTIPRAGMDRKTYLERKFGGAARAKSIYDTIVEAGKSENIPFDFKAIRLSPNTLDAHRIIRWAANVEAQDTVVEALFAAYFIEGRDIGDTDTLVDIATASGMDRAIVRDLLDRDADRDLVGQEAAMARSLGIEGVPCFILANRVAISGAQDPGLLARAIRQTAEGTIQAASA